MSAPTASRLSETQVENFWRDGYVVVEEAVTAAQLERMRVALAQWIDESRSHDAPYGETVDGRPRFDLARSHSADAPALRRVDNPPEIEPAYAEVAFDGGFVDMIADLIGPDLKFHHAKVNLKQPRSETRVGWHQDFSYTPHSNDHVVTALLMLDDMSLDNGCLMGVPGSHREGQKSLWQDQVFTGEVDEETTRAAISRARPIHGRKGSVCLMHTKLLHGSGPNRSPSARALFICVYSAADAVPLTQSPLPNRFQGRIVRGRESRFARIDPGVVELPPAYRAASFFELQEKGIG
ncbi:MAG TPA: phytanoyl-CoA dioxygenase family protein [Gammaproteobacteria bacterium]|nr:phytanoyl-CoA dioxygenase family protein [Gammaproteobacteria bacterium]